MHMSAGFNLPCTSQHTALLLSDTSTSNGAKLNAEIGERAAASVSQDFDTLVTGEETALKSKCHWELGAHMQWAKASIWQHEPVYYRTREQKLENNQQTLTEVQVCKQKEDSHERRLYKGQSIKSVRLNPAHMFPEHCALYLTAKSNCPPWPETERRHRSTALRRSSWLIKL